MVATILSWLVAIVLLVLGLATVTLVLLANGMRPAPGPLGGGDGFFLGCGLVSVAVGVLFLVLLVKGY